MPQRAQTPAPLFEGLVVAGHGRRYTVELSDGVTLLDCAPRGKKSDVACGDRVQVLQSSGATGAIEQILPRSSLLYRSDAYKQKLFAANVTQALIVVAPVPSFYDDLLNRCLAACEYAAIKPVILLNKTDLPQSAAASASLELYRALGYQVVGIRAKFDAGALPPLLEGHVSVLVGQSGMGKSTIINSLLPDAALRVAEHSAALDSGRHTTSGARLYHLNSASHIIDSPGVQVFGLHHLDIEDTVQAFIEFRELQGQCRFRDCRHVAEPGCAVADACATGKIHASRLASYRRLVEELLHARSKRYN